MIWKSLRERVDGVSKRNGFIPHFQFLKVKDSGAVIRPQLSTLNRHRQRDEEPAGLPLSRGMAVGEAALWTPPEPVVFGPHPVGQLTLANGDQGVRRMLSLIGEWRLHKEQSRALP